MEITVTLPTGYLARDVSLKVQRRSYARRTWEIVATDNNGWTTGKVEVDGSPVPTFKRRCDAVAHLGMLRFNGVDIWRIFATPRESNMRTYVVPGKHGAPVHVVQAYA